MNVLVTRRRRKRTAASHGHRPPDLPVPGGRPHGPLRPPLKWAGGKRWQLRHLVPYWHPHRHHRLVEPFCGGLAVTLGLMPERAVLNDANPHVINFYRWIRRGLVIDLEMANDQRLYYAHRDRFNRLLADGRRESAEAASLFYYLNRTGYNGLCRFNRRGLFNVPFGRYRSIDYGREFPDHQKAFSNWEFRSGDFESLPLLEDDFVYADPPYDVPFTHYAKGGFSFEDQIRTAEWLSRHRGPVVLSNQATGRIVELYRTMGFRLRFLDAPRMISCTGDRSRAREVLALKNL